MKKKLEQGVTLVVDRYSFSGVAFTSAKLVSSLLLVSSDAVKPSPSANVSSGSSAGLVSGLVHESGAGAAQARPRHVPEDEPGGGGGPGSVWHREVRDQQLPEGGSGEV